MPKLCYNSLFCTFFYWLLPEQLAQVYLEHSTNRQIWLLENQARIIFLNILFNEFMHLNLTDKG